MVIQWKDGKLLRVGLSFLLLLLVVVGTLTVGVKMQQAQASSCQKWYLCPISQYFGVHERYSPGVEHGVDLLTHGLPITPLYIGTITFLHWECWGSECIWDITWKLDHPWLLKGSPYMYVQIDTLHRGLRVGMHITRSTILGWSRLFIEFGLTPDWAYGVSNWRLGINPLFALQRFGHS